MRLARRGVGWDRASRARVYSIAGRILALVGALGTAYGLDWTVVLPDALEALLGTSIAVGVMSMLLGLSVASEAPREKMGDVEIDAAGAVHVRVEKQSRTFAREQLSGAWVVRGFNGKRFDYFVEIGTRSGTIVLVHALNEDEAHALVEALGFGAAGRAVRIPLANRSRRQMHMFLGFVALLLPLLSRSSHPILSVAVIAVGYALLRTLFRAPVFEIGHDALHVHVDVRTIRIPRADIARVVFRGALLVVELKDGSKVRANSMGLDPQRVAAAVSLINGRIANSPAPMRAGAFERGGRGLAEWRAGLQTALEPTYRTSGTSADDATEVLASSTASVEQRIGAALTLRVAGEPLDKVRIAAEGTVEPKIRVVLEAIADAEDDEVLDQKLRAMER